MASSEITHDTVELNGVDYHYLSAGSGNDGPLVICVHGFPDTPKGWTPLLTRLSGLGHRVVAPWMRGYGPTAVPPDGSGAISAWIADVCELHEQLGDGSPAVLVGHDWGAVTAYGSAAFAPERWSRIVAASVPPMAVTARRIFDYDQIKAFWYQYVFLQPTAEMIVSENDFEFIRRLWQDWSPGHDEPDDVGAAVDALSGPGHLSVALDTYRSMYDPSLQPPQFAAQAAAVMAPSSLPTLYLHGTEDGCMPGEDLVDETRAMLPEGSAARHIEGAGHFVQYEKPDEVTEAIVEFIA